MENPLKILPIQLLKELYFCSGRSVGALIKAENLTCFRIVYYQPLL